MTYLASKDFTWQNNRGGSYIATLTFSDDMLNGEDKVVDVNFLPEAEAFFDPLHRKSDEESWGFKPTYELMAVRIYRVLSQHYPQLSSVKVSGNEIEGPVNAEYRR